MSRSAIWATNSNALLAVWEDEAEYEDGSVCKTEDGRACVSGVVSKEDAVYENRALAEDGAVCEYGALCEEGLSCAAGSLSEQVHACEDV